MNELELPIPEHFDREKVGEVWRVDYGHIAGAAQAWAKHHNLTPAGQDKRRLALLIIDCQNTFCIPGFELFIGGRSGTDAVQDNVRLCEFIYRNLGVITKTFVSLDTHTALQIFHPAWLVDSAGNHPAPYTPIPLEDVESGKWTLSPAARESIGNRLAGDPHEYILHYCRTLARGGKYTHMIWPYHAMRGGIGHALVSSLEEALFFHTIARQSQMEFLVKGDNPLTENYSILSPEVTDDQHGNPLAASNAGFVDKVLSYDAVLIAGQAKSHCLKSTVEDLLQTITEREIGLADKTYLLEDTSSPVVVPGGMDFTEEANEAFARFAEAGMHRVRCTDPFHTWPGMAS